VSRRLGLGCRLRKALACALTLAWVGCAPAQAPLEVEETSEPGALLRRASERQRAGDVDGAVAALDPLLGGPLRAHAGLLRARWLRAARRPEPARDEASRALASGPVREVSAQLRAELGAAYLDLGDVLAAYREQQEAWELTLDAQRGADWALAFAGELERRGADAEAHRIYERIWQRWASTRAALPAFERWLAAASPGMRQAAVPELLAFGTKLRGSARCESALDLTAMLLRMSTLRASERRAARELEAGCVFQQRRYAEAAKLFDALVKSRPRDVDAAIFAARAKGRAGDASRAVKDLREIARRAPPEDAPRARLLAALIAQDSDPALARRLLRAVADQNLDRNSAEEARWQLAWDALSRRATAQALRWLEPLARGASDNPETSRARYWRAVATLDVNAADGRRQLREIAEEAPLSYYGFLASERLGEKPVVERSLLGARGPASESEGVRVASRLIAGGFPDAARDELASWLADASLGTEERVQVAQLLHELGDHFRGVGLVVNEFGPALERGIDPEWREVWQAAWPRPFEQTVRTAVEEFGFDAALVYAIMREESTYRPEVQSPAGARGLMQIIPPTAERIASALGDDSFGPERLYDPATNVRFGTYYLRQLGQQFQDSRPLMIAAYNAGPDIVERWLELRGTLPTDRFVDSVPYTETRRYLRRVLRSYRMYQLVYPEGLLTDRQRSGAALATAQPADR
jgi:soluble lytic murein transglycosylase